MPGTQLSVTANSSGVMNHREQLSKVDMYVFGLLYLDFGASQSTDLLRKSHVMQSRAMTGWITTRRKLYIK